MIVHVSYNVTSCVDCPYIRKGIGSLSNVVLYRCTNGVFGALDEHGHTIQGLSTSLWMPAV